MLKFLAKSIYEPVRFQKMRWSVWRKFRCFLPSSTIIATPKFIKIGKNLALGKFCQIYCQDPEKGSVLEIGNNVSLNSNAMIIANEGGKIYIGNDVLLGPNVVLRAANHSFESKNIPIRSQGHKGGTIVLEDDVWLGAGVVVLPNVRIGKGSVVGAGSVVTKDIPPFSVAMGVPAHVVRSR
ncbi:MAG: acyltransferase [Deltaproteobacteria bacterium]|nr:acyltransferase [Deltaproteobacteria bacterium]